MSHNKNKKEKIIMNAGITGASYETVQRYGSAVKEYVAAYSGVNNEVMNSTTGDATILQKSLKSIKEQKTNEKYAFSIRQQKAGWAAEVKDTANVNAEKIIGGDLSRKIRHDDLPDTPANHQLYDHIEIDAAGNILDSSGSQMKFIGASQKDPQGIGNAGRALKKLQSKEFQKYIDNDVKIEVPKDEYKQMVDKATEEIGKLEGQLKRAKASDSVDTIERLEVKIKNLKKLKMNLQPSTLTRRESLEAVDRPLISTAKSVANVSHQAGLNVAESAALIGGSVALVKNVVSIYKGEIEAEDAMKNIVFDTANSVVAGYGTGFAGATIKGIMQNSTSEYVRGLSKTNVAGTMVAATVGVTKSLKKYFGGEIDAVECLEDLGEQGTGMIASSMFTVIGQAAIPIPVIGGLIGSMIGYSLSSATYGILTTSLKEAKLARKERIEIEKACQEHVQMMRVYRAEINQMVETYLSDTMTTFNEIFSGIGDALALGDTDLLIDSANRITETLGGNKPFETKEEFNEKMCNGIPFQL